jgi:multidrug transporter EmrE-like cation transporter
MFRLNLPHGQEWLARDAATPVVLIGGNLLFNVVANVSFKLSAFSPAWRGFLGWQIVGNLAGFITVLTLTALLRFMPLHLAYPVTTGLAVLGVQVAAAGLIFHEPVSSTQWLGVLLIIVGVVLVSGR